MAFTQEKENGNTLLKIEDDLSIYDVAGIRQALLGCLESEGGLALDLSAVTRCDAAGLQLLCAIRKSAHGRHKPYRVMGISSAVLDAMKIAGLDSGEIMEGECPETGIREEEDRKHIEAENG